MPPVRPSEPPRLFAKLVFIIKLVLVQVIVLIVVVLFRLDIQYHLERFLVHGHLCGETRQVEVVFDKVFADFGKVLVAEEGAEGRDP